MSKWLEKKLEENVNPQNIFNDFQKKYGNRIEKSIKKYKNGTLQSQILTTKVLENLYEKLKRNSEDIEKQNIQALRNKNTEKTRIRKIKRGIQRYDKMAKQTTSKFK